MRDVGELSDKSWVMEDVLCDVNGGDVPELKSPAYLGKDSKGIMLAVESMKSHMTDEGNQLQMGLQDAGYELWGNNYPNDETHVPTILNRANPGVVVVQDKREWHITNVKSFRDKKACFKEIEALERRHDIFKLTVLKDAQQRNGYHSDSANEMGAHGWIIYYHPDIVKHMAPFVRKKHLVRTYHSIDPRFIPEYSPVRVNRSLISGATCKAYPLRNLLIKKVWFIKGLDVLPHPGYHRNGTATPSFMQKLSTYKISICTASMYGYSLRKMIESTACGCIVLTNLPSDDVLPEIDGNLIRIRPDMPYKEINKLVQELEANYNPERQRYYAETAKLYYSYQARGLQLADDIETLRKSYKP